MRYVVVFKIADEVLEATEIATAHIRNEMRRIKKDGLCKSLRLLNPVIEAGRADQDFINEYTAVRIKFDAYKISRVIKKLLYGRRK